MAKKPVDKAPFLKAVAKELGDVKTISRAEVFMIMKKYKLKDPLWLTKNDAVRVGRGLYALTDEVHPDYGTPVKVTRSSKKNEVKVESVPVVDHHEAMIAMAASAVAHGETHQTLDLIPKKAKGYVPFGNFSDVRSIVKSKRFYPVYITGLSGNGKTMMVEQVHAVETKELIRVNVTIETDEDDLLGGFRLIDGKTVWQDGPVVIAMQRGATLLLDEVDLGSNKMMCLQPVMEGKSIFLKKINRLVTPAPGFNVIATANTKGKGSEDGRFIGTNVQNEAMLDRYAITLEQEYPATKVEAKILKNVLGEAGVEDANFVDRLVTWADVVRKTFAEGGVTEIISTRRLVNICDAFIIFNDRAKAIQLCLNRFDVETKTTFMELYAKLDETIDPKKPEKMDDVEIAF